MTANQIGGILRALLPALAGFAAGYGIDQQTWLTISGAVVTLVMAIWSVYTNSTGEVVKQAAQSPEVKEIVTEPALAFYSAHGKVKADDPERDYL